MSFTEKFSKSLLDFEPEPFKGSSKTLVTVLQRAQLRGPKQGRKPLEVIQAHVLYYQDIIGQIENRHQRQHLANLRDCANNTIHNSGGEDSTHCEISVDAMLDTLVVCIEACSSIAKNVQDVDKENSRLEKDLSSANAEVVRLMSVLSTQTRLVGRLQGSEHLASNVGLC